MTDELLATSSTTIDAPPHEVWSALTTPAIVKRYMFGTDLESDFDVGGPITWSGEYDGEIYEDHGTVLAVEPGRRLQVSHFSPLSGLPDVPENYHTLTYLLEPAGEGTLVTLTQDGNDTAAAKEHSEANWDAMLASLKAVVESAD